MIVVALDPKLTHGSLDCRSRLVQKPDGTWICADCGREIVWTRINTRGMDELVDALALLKDREEDWKIAGHDGTLAAGMLAERMLQVEKLLEAVIDRLSEENP